MWRNLIICFLFFSCEEVTYWPDSVEKYAIKFEHKAIENRYEINYDGLKIITTSKLKNNYHAYYAPSEHAIYIDTSSTTWKEFPEETFVHEMGHAVVKRYHDMTRLDNGMYKSVMGNYSAPSLAGWSKHDSMRYRENYYYAELFNPKINQPYWSK